MPGDTIPYEDQSFQDFIQAVVVRFPFRNLDMFVRSDIFDESQTEGAIEEYFDMSLLEALRGLEIDDLDILPDDRVVVDRDTLGSDEPFPPVWQSADYNRYYLVEGSDTSNTLATYRFMEGHWFVEKPRL